MSACTTLFAFVLSSVSFLAFFCFCLLSVMTNTSSEDASQSLEKSYDLMRCILTNLPCWLVLLELTIRSIAFPDMVSGFPNLCFDLMIPRANVHFIYLSFFVTSATSQSIVFRLELLRCVTDRISVAHGDHLERIDISRNVAEEHGGPISIDRRKIRKIKLK